jgi:hypothetical protein
MRLETLPLLFGLLLAIPGIALIADAFIKDGTFLPERRRRERPTRHKPGEAALGVGLLFVSAALVGRDTWPYTTLAIVLALLFFAGGIALNHKYIRGLMFGPAIGPSATRRSTDPPPPAEPTEPSKTEKIRIR